MAESWYYACDGKKSGPVTLEELQDLVDDGQLRAGDIVCRQGTRNWVSAYGMDELFGDGRARRRPRGGRPEGRARERDDVLEGIPVEAAPQHQFVPPPSTPPSAPPPPSVAAPVLWYYTRDRKNTLGPIPFDELRKLAMSGKLVGADMVLKAGTTNWLSAATVTELFPPPAPKAAPPPPMTAPPPAPPPLPRPAVTEALRPGAPPPMPGSPPQKNGNGKKE